MNLSSFINFIKTPDIPGFSILQFIDDEYQYLFFSKIINFFKKDPSSELLTLEINKLQLEEIISRLSLGFLGKRIIYWIKDFNILQESEKNKLIQYFENYQGPNSIIFFDSGARLTDNANKLLVYLNNKVTFGEYQQLFKLFFPNGTSNSLFIQKIFDENIKLSLDKACMLMNYESCLGKNYNIFLEKWLKKILITEKSLFNLSNFLLELNRKQFFNLWSNYKDEYPEEFWVTFFSELIWQAILFINRVDKYGIIDAKKAAQKLPFSFMNKNWKHYNLKFLIKVYQELYKIDFDIKNGLSPKRLDLWCSKFFLCG